jgi:hypothetical protein
MFTIDVLGNIKSPTRKISQMVSLSCFFSLAKWMFLQARFAGQGYQNGLEHILKMWLLTQNYQSRIFEEWALESRQAATISNSMYSSRNCSVHSVEPRVLHTSIHYKTFANIYLKHLLDEEYFYIVGIVN